MSYKRWVLAAILLFVIGLAFGVATPAVLAPEAFAAFREFSGILTSLSPVLIAIIIFIKNASVLLFSFALSPILCLIPILTLTVNGWMLAAVSTIVAEEQSLGLVLAALLPHGIIEIPALILGEAAALNFGATAIMTLLRKGNGKGNLLLTSFRQNLKYLMIALALLLPAAIIETYVTPLFLR